MAAIALAAANRWTGTAGARWVRGRPGAPGAPAYTINGVLHHRVVRTDNIFSIQSYCSNHFGISGSDFLRQFDLPETFDSINEEDAFAPPPTKGSKGKASSAPAEKWRKASEAVDDGEGAAAAGEADGADYDAGDFE